MTDVITTYLSPISRAAIATLCGSLPSGGRGMDESTEQKPQSLVHDEPSIIKVAVGFEKQMPIFGQRASSHTEDKPYRLRVLLVS